MGCFQSKVNGSRTPSFRIRVCLQNDRARSRIFEDPSLRDREEQFLALLYNPSTVVMKLKAQEGRDKLSINLLDKISSGENRLIHDGPHMVNAWELMAGLDEEEEEENEEMKNKKDKQCSSTDQLPPASDDGSLAQIDEIHVSDFLSSCSADDDDEDETGEPPLVENNIHAEATARSGTRDGGDLVSSEAAAGDRDVLSESIRFLIIGERSEKEPNISVEEILQSTSTPSFRFPSMAAAHLKLRMGSEEEEPASGSSTPTFGASMESELSRGTTAEDHGIGVSFHVHLEREEALMTAEDEDLFMKILQDFLDKVHEAN